MPPSATQIPETAQDRPLVSRTSVLILALLLIGMGFGARVPMFWSQACLAFGMLGLAAYLGLEVVGKHRAARKNAVQQKSAEHELVVRVRQLQGRPPGSRSTHMAEFVVPANPERASAPNETTN